MRCLAIFVLLTACLFLPSISLTNRNKQTVGSYSCSVSTSVHKAFAEQFPDYKQYSVLLLICLGPVNHEGHRAKQFIISVNQSVKLIKQSE